jgi:DNA polymerase-1
MVTEMIRKLKLKFSSKDRRILVVLDGTYKGEWLVRMHKLPNMTVFLSLPDKLERIIPDKDIEWGLKNKVLDNAGTLPKKVYNVCKAEYEHAKRNNTLHRAHWIAKNTNKPLVNSKGQETGTLFTFLRTIKTNATTFNTNKIYIAWDTKLTNQVNFRKTLTEGTYKGTRDHARNKEVYDSMPIILDSLKALGVKSIFPGSLEADDVISWLSKTVIGRKIIISVDNDFAQLVSPEVSFYNPIKKIIVDSNNFEEHFKLTPREYVFFKAIVGDTSDNISGIEGFGKVKGAKLAKAFVNGDTSLINPYIHKVHENLKLVDLSYGINNNAVEIDLYMQQYTTLQSVKPNFDDFKRLCEDLEFSTFVNELDKWKSTFGKSMNESIVDFCKMFE